MGEKRRFALQVFGDHLHRCCSSSSSKSMRSSASVLKQDEQPLELAAPRRLVEGNAEMIGIDGSAD